MDSSILKYKEVIFKLIAEKKYDLALDLCCKHLEDNQIRKEAIFLCIKKLDNYQRAYELWLEYNNNMTNNINYAIVGFGINILHVLYGADDAYDYASNFDINDTNDNQHFAVSLVKVLIDKKNYEEALEICDRPGLSNVREINNLKKKILKLQDKTSDIVSIILAKIKTDTITLDEIKSSNITDYEKIYLLAIYYDKVNNSKLGLGIVKKAKTIYKDKSKSITKILNVLEQRLSSNKNKIFDIAFYSELLNRTIDFELIDSLENSKEKDSIVEEGQIVNKKIDKKEIKPVVEVKKRVEKKKPTIISIGGSKHVNRYSNQVIDNTKSLINNKPAPVKKMKDIFSEELDAVGRYLYVKMQDRSTTKDAIKAWDNLQELKERDITDTDSLKKVVSLLKKISITRPDIVEVEESKIKKYSN